MSQDSPEPAPDSLPDSLDGLAELLAADWRAVMAPIAAALVSFLRDQPDLETAGDQLAGLVPALPVAALAAALRGASLQARAAGMLGVPVVHGESGEAEFAEAGEALVKLTPLADAEAIRFMLQKQVGRLSFDWRDVREAEHALSFVVAKGMSRELLGDIHEHLVLSLSQGWTRDRFVREMTPILQARGWWGQAPVFDPKTGETRISQLGSPRRLKTIYDVNIRMAHAAGRWERLSKIARPGDLLRYTAVLDSRTREEHRDLHGTVLPPEHPFWDIYYPPNGWNCRCSTILVLAEVARGRGLAATSEEELAAKGVGETYPWLNTRSGEIESIPKGVSPGFAYNVGKARLNAFTPEPGGAPPAGAAGPPATRAVLFGQPKAAIPEPPEPRAWVGRLWPEDLPPAEASARALAIAARRSRLVGPGQLVFDDAAQMPLAISERLFRKDNGAWKIGRDRIPYLPVLLETIFDPDEIWLAFELLFNAAGERIGAGWRRRFLARWLLPGQRDQAMLAVFEEAGETWTGVTSFAPAVGDPPGEQWRYLENQARAGALVWARKRS